MYLCMSYNVFVWNICFYFTPYNFFPTHLQFVDINVSSLACDFPQWQFCLEEKIAFSKV